MRLLLLTLCAGCALGGAEGGGGDALPVSGVGPYRKITDFELVTPLDEPFIVYDLTADLGDPAPIALERGTRLFYTRGGGEIWRSDLPSLTEPPGEPALALAPTEPWEQAAVRAPSLVAQGSTLIMFYQGGGGIGRATSGDGGASWTKTGMVLPDATSPSVVVASGRWYLYHTRPDAPGVYLATSPDGMTWQAGPQPVLGTHAGAFDSRSLADPQASGGITPAGELHIGLFYTGVNAAGLSAIGYAGSEDGETFVARPTPILDPKAPGERAPAPLLRPSSDILFFVQDRSNRPAIGAATAP